MNDELDKFLITSPIFYKNIDKNLKYALSLGVSKVYLRDLKLSKSLLLSFIKSCKKYNILLFINYIVDFLSYDIAGIHLRGQELGLRDKLANFFLVSYSAHSLNDVIKAYEMNVNFIFLSPIFSLENKNPMLGIEYIQRIPPIYRDSIYALGGINFSNESLFFNLGIRGIAGIRMFIKE